MFIIKYLWIPRKGNSAKKNGPWRARSPKLAERGTVTRRFAANEALPAFHRSRRVVHELSHHLVVAADRFFRAHAFVRDLLLHVRLGRAAASRPGTRARDVNDPVAVLDDDGIGALDLDHARLADRVSARRAGKSRCRDQADQHRA